MADTKPEAEALAVIEAARCIKHWHDAHNGGMIVSGEHVHALWDALDKYDAALSKPSVAPDDEALVQERDDTLAAFKSAPGEPSTELLTAFYVADEALRRRIAGLRSDNAQLQYALEQSEMRYSEKEAALAACRDDLHMVKRMAEMSAGIMRDPRRTGAWEGAERVARQFDRIAVKASLKTKEPTNG